MTFAPSLVICGSLTVRRSHTVSVVSGRFALAGPVASRIDKTATHILIKPRWRRRFACALWQTPLLVRGRQNSSAEVFHGIFQSLVQRNLRLPAQYPLGLGNVGPALPGIVLRQWSPCNRRGAVRQLANALGEFQD